MKKTAIITVIAFILITGSMNVFAATVLDTNLITLIQNYIKPQNVTEELKADSTQTQADLKAYMSSELQKAKIEIDTHKNTELSLAKNEIDTYANQLKSELATALTTEKNTTKEKISTDIDKEVSKIKNDLNKTVQDMLTGNN